MIFAYEDAGESNSDWQKLNDLIMELKQMPDPPEPNKTENISTRGNQGSCDATLGDVCYTLVHDYLTWQEARDNCQEMGGQLVQINSLDEDLIISGLALSQRKDVWIDATDTAREGLFKWETSSNEMQFMNWNYGEPNNANGNEDCVVMDGYYKRWNDISCNSRRKSVCQETIGADQSSSTEDNNECYSKVYLLVEEPMDWSSASQKCAEIGAYLVEIDNLEEDQFVYDVAQGISTDIWIGASDQATEGTWRWEESGTVISYEHWNPGEPNNYSNDEDCACMKHSASFGWNDSSCSRTLPALCEKEI